MWANQFANERTMHSRFVDVFFFFSSFCQIAFDFSCFIFQYLPVPLAHFFFCNSDIIIHSKQLVNIMTKLSYCHYFYLLCLFVFLCVPFLFLLVSLMLICHQDHCTCLCGFDVVKNTLFLSCLSLGNENFYSNRKVYSVLISFYGGG